MQPESQKYVYDIHQSISRLTSFVAGRTFADYEGNDMLRAAVERQFEIIGEALAQLERRDPPTASKIREHRRIIAFRNILIHGYADVDNQLVWDIVETKLDRLQEDVASLLGGEPGD